MPEPKTNFRITDLAQEERPREAGLLQDIELLDHRVIGQGRYVSMQKQRLAFA